MKGKYANKAQKRREVVAAEQNASAAEAARADAESALVRYQDSAENKIARLEERLAAALAERDAVAAPRIAELEQQVEAMHQRAHDAEANTEAVKQAQAHLVHFTAKLLHNLTGCTGLEAAEKICAAVKGIPEFNIADATTGGSAGNGMQLSFDGTKTLQRVRGWRSSPQVIAHLDSLIEAAAGRGE